MRELAVLIAVACLAGMTAAPPARAFDTGPHGDMTVDAMTAEGFGADAADIARVNNWFVDFYANASKVPYTHQSPLWKTIIAGGLGNREDWPGRLVDAAAASHMDSATRVIIDGQKISLRDPAAMEKEWERMRFVTYRLVQRAKRERSPLGLLTAIGISLHPLQDFYSHTNWPETPTDVDGPGWLALRQGSVPTWFDAAAPVRAGVRLYAGGAEGAPRRHGEWAQSQAETLAKDWPGRPRYAEAYMTTYFATRQWVRAIRTWLADEALWRAAQGYASNLRALDHDVYGATMISTYSGHLYGEGGPCDPGCGASSGWGGSLVALRTTVQNYFEDRGKTIFRKTFETLMPELAIPQPLGVRLSDVPVEPSTALQAATRFVRLRVLSMRGLGLGDIGPDDADLYARATLAGQRFVSPILQAHDRFSFPPPYYPFTFIKAVPRDGVQPEPVETMIVRVRTSSVRSAGTDDDVFLRIGQRRFELDKRAYDDFERGDDDTYSVPIDAATRDGLDRAEISRVQIEKSRDGVAGAWRLRGVTLTVNGRVLYSKDGIERWLEDDRRSWRAPGFAARPMLGGRIGAWLDLREDDLRIYGSDDQGDLNRYDARDAISVAYPVGGVIETPVTGGDLLGGRLGIGGDRARVRYSIDTLDPVVPRPVLDPGPLAPIEPTPPAPPQPPAPRADLAISAFGLETVTVLNQGAGAAGPFNVRVGTTTIRIAGLGPGQSDTRAYGSGCGATLTARADADAEVVESDETNNDRTELFVC